MAKKSGDYSPCLKALFRRRRVEGRSSLLTTGAAIVGIKQSVLDAGLAASS